MVGGRNLAASGDPSARFVLSIDGAEFQAWEASPGFFLHVFDVPAGRLAGDGTFARLSIRSTAASGAAAIPTAIEQFDLQNDSETVWGYDAGWNEAEYAPSLGVWRWTSDRASVRIAGPSRDRRITMWVESPLRYFDAPALVRALAGPTELASTVLGQSGQWSFDVPADALSASGGVITIETDQTFVPAEVGGGADQRRLGLRVFAFDVAFR
jgi:hypothetical protein